MQAILVPVKSFRDAKHRLIGALDDEARAQLARDLAHIVLHAGGEVPVHVACDDSEVADWAVSEGAMVLWTPGLGLSGAVGAGFRYLGAQGFDFVIVAHADLPFARGLDSFGSNDAVVIAPDHRLDGTNVISVPTSHDFVFRYGPRSYLNHRMEAERHHLSCTTVFDWRLASDIDLPRDLPLVAGLVESENPDVNKP